jgi:LmbE family N-acetylglucosaminyl deacetylase
VTRDVRAAPVLTDPDDVPGLGTILNVWAHPDDEAYLAAGLMALSIRAGNRVACVTATRGELGTSDPETWPPPRLARERTEELQRSLAAYGVTEHVWLDLPDGGCAEIPDEEVIPRLTQIVRDVRPQTVLTFGPDGMTGHPDHIAVSRWTTLAFREAAPTGATLHYATLLPDWYETWEPIANKLKIIMDESAVATTPRHELSIDMTFPANIVDIKFEALRTQVTQTAVMIEAVGEEAFRAWIADETYRLAARAG